MITLALAPVAVFAYKRKEHLMQTLEALENCALSSDTEVFVFSDAARTLKDKEEVDEVRRFLEEYCLRSKFRRISVEYAEKNKGLSNSIIDGVSKILNQFGKIIVLEDDIIVAQDFLIYMNDCLNVYKTNNKIWSISGFVEDFDFLHEHEDKTFAYWRADCWGWGTWNDRWQQVDWNVEDYKKFAFSKKRRKEFNKGGEDLSRMLDAQMYGAINSWAIRWCYSSYQKEMLSIHPTISRTYNIGLDGTGEHCVKNVQGDEAYVFSKTSCVISDSPFDGKLCKKYTQCMKNRYSYVYRLRKNIKSLIRRISFLVRN